jgi:hypothetical protein
MIPPIGTDHVLVYNDESRSEHVLDHLLEPPTIFFIVYSTIFAFKPLPTNNPSNVPS